MTDNYSTKLAATAAAMLVASLLLSLAEAML